MPKGLHIPHFIAFISCIHTHIIQHIKLSNSSCENVCSVFRYYSDNVYRYDYLSRNRPILSALIKLISGSQPSG